MSRRSGIVDSLTNLLKENITGDGFSTGFFGNIYNSNLSFDEITDFPSATVTPSVEVRQYEASSIIWRFLTVHVRVYVKNNSDPTAELEALISDIEEQIDRGYELEYTIFKGGEPIDVGATTDINIESTTTDEGALAPLAFGELTLTVRYHTTRPL